MSVMTIGMDTSKSWFQVHGVNEAFDKQILSLARESEVCRRLMTVLTIGRLPPRH
jgi:hypothetical protein